MGHLRRLTPLFLLGALALSGCGKKRSLEVPTQPSAPAPVLAPKPIELRTADGALKGSDVRVEWLEIPLAFKPTGRDRERHRVFQAEGVSMEQTRDFLGQRMLTGRVDEGKRTVVYHKVLPPSGAADAVRLNVQLTQLDGTLTLDVERLAYDTPPLPFEAAKQAAEADQKYAH